MNKTLFVYPAVFILCLSSGIVLSQNLILNGSFENNSATGNMYGLTSGWSGYVADSYEVDGGTMDLVTTDVCGSPFHGNWFVRTTPQSGLWPYLAFSFKLNAPVVQGAQYNFHFNKMYCGPNTSSIDIGISNDSDMIGTYVHSFAPPTVNSWVTENYTFQSPVNGLYLTVNIGVFGSTGQVAVDNFILEESSSGIHENGLSRVEIFPNPATGNFRIRNVPPAAEIDILDISGVTLMETESAGNDFQINICSLAKGIYFLRVTAKTGQKFFKLIIG